MKFIDYINTFGMDLIIQGRTYPSYLINYRESYEEPKQFVHIFYVEDEDCFEEHEVTIKNNGEEIYDATCTCARFKRNQKCEHISACLFKYRYAIINCKIKDL